MFLFIYLRMFRFQERRKKEGDEKERILGKSGRLAYHVSKLEEI
jgi:hypothetical protein